MIWVLFYYVVRGYLCSSQDIFYGIWDFISFLEIGRRWLIDYFKSYHVALWQLCLWHWSLDQPPMACVVGLILLKAKGLIFLKGKAELRWPASSTKAAKPIQYTRLSNSDSLVSKQIVSSKCCFLDIMISADVFSDVNWREHTWEFQNLKDYKLSTQ